MNKITLITGIIFCLSSFSCNQGKKDPVVSLENLNIQANMAFFYYKDMARAEDFYENILGLRLVLDYGFAKAYQISPTSFICLVDETKGMHNTSEPKSVTLSFVTQEIDAWYEYLQEQGVKMHSPLGDATSYHIRGFVAYDPEGYYLEFETFLDEPLNAKLTKQLSQSSAIYPQSDQTNSRPEKLGIQGNVIWLYYKDMEKAERFYEDIIGLELLVEQSFSKVYLSSATGFIGLVDEAKGLHKYSEKKSVNIGFFSNQIDDWYDYLIAKGLKMRGPVNDAEGGLVRAFITYDVAGYYLEFDKFHDHDKNKVLLEIMKK